MQESHCIGYKVGRHTSSDEKLHNQKPKVSLNQNIGGQFLTVY